MCHVLKYLMESSTKLISEQDLDNLQNMSSEEWQEIVRDLKGQNACARSFVSANSRY